MMLSGFGIVEKVTRFTPKPRDGLSNCVEEHVPLDQRRSHVVGDEGVLHVMFAILRFNCTCVHVRAKFCFPLFLCTLCCILVFDPSTMPQ